MEKYHEKDRTMKNSFTKLVLIMAAFLSGAASSAELDRNRIITGYGSGDADIKLEGTLYDGDLSGSSISALIYLGDDFYGSFGTGTTELEVVGVNIDQDQTTFGGGVVIDGGIDLITGNGEEFRIGLAVTDYEVKQGSTSVSGDITDAVAAYEKGIGDGLSYALYFTTDTDELFSDNTYTARLSKSIGANLIVGAQYGFAKSVTDSDNSVEQKMFSLGLGFVF